MTRIEWYFDFISPYAYLQAERLARLDPRPAFVAKPVLFAGLLSHWGQLGPAEIPAKRLFTGRFVHWRARELDLQLVFPPAHPFNPLKALRLAVALKADFDVVMRIFRYIWREGRSLEDEGAFTDLCAELGVADAPTVLRDPAVKQGLIAHGKQALAKQVFGVPTLAIGDMLFWGEDATDMALAYARDPSILEGPEMSRLTDLPVGATRPR